MSWAENLGCLVSGIYPCCDVMFGHDWSGPKKLLGGRIIARDEVFVVGVPCLAIDCKTMRNCAEVIASLKLLQADDVQRNDEKAM